MARGCLFCHTTDPRAVVENIPPASLDRAIGCERCHGPGGNHVAAVSASPPLPDLAIAAETGLASPPAVNRLCGECHSPRGGMTASPDDPSSVRFQATALTWSRCYTDSGEALGCLSCHDPHRNASRQPSHYEAKCKSCHNGATDPQAVARTVCPVNKTSDCLKCHMPVVRTSMIPHSPFTDHFIRIHRGEGAGVR
jgi:hypothetical protein